MSTAHVEALVMGGLSLFWLSLSALAFRAQRKSGYKSQWRYVGLFGAAVAIVLMTLNLNGYVFTGSGKSGKAGSMAYDSAR